MRGEENPKVGGVQSEVIVDGTNEDEGNKLLPELLDDSSMRLARVGESEFEKEQETDSSLSAVRVKTKLNKLHYDYKDSFTVKKTRDHWGNDRRKLDIPLKFRQGIVNSCHEGISRICKKKQMKDKILSYFFWPNVVKEQVNFVNSRDPWHRASKSGG